MPRLPSLSLVGQLAIDYGLHYELVLLVEGLDLTGATATAQISNELGAIAVAFVVSIAVQSPVLAEMTFVLEAIAQSNAPGFRPGVYDWDVLLVPAVTTPEYLFGGKVVVHRRVSHAA